MSPVQILFKFAIVSLFYSYSNGEKENYGFVSYGNSFMNLGDPFFVNRKENGVTETPHHEEVHEEGPEQVRERVHERVHEDVLLEEKTTHDENIQDQFTPEQVSSGEDVSEYTYEINYEEEYPDRIEKEDEKFEGSSILPKYSTPNRFADYEASSGSSDQMKNHEDSIDSDSSLYKHIPSAHHPPLCAKSSKLSFCLKDKKYPLYEIEKAANKNYDKLKLLYADLSNLSVSNSVDLPKHVKYTKEIYLCPSKIYYAKPLRAKNAKGEWKIIVNGVRVHYETLTQSARIEQCLKNGQSCPLVPSCNQSKCVQKSVYHRFLIYDPYHKYFPFAIDSFKLPASCGCVLGASKLPN